MEKFLNQNELINKWKKFIKLVEKNPTIRPVTMDAWKRCSDIGLDPNDLRFKFLSRSQLKEKLQQNSQLIKASNPYLEHLSLSLRGIPHLVTLTDSYGWVINYKGTSKVFGGKKCGIALGASWSERNVGNNGVGTSLAIGEPVLIYGMEHFRKSYSPFTCIGVPIKVNQKIIGGIDVAVPNEYAHPSRLNLAVACASSIESTLTITSSDITMPTTSELIATAVHDLKNPLAVIRGLGQLGKLTSDKNTASSYFDRVIKQTDELNTMVVSLLGIFKPQETFPMKAAPIIKDVLESVTPECSSRGIKLSFIEDCDETVSLCESLFKRAITNLICNSIQVMEDSGLIEIKMQREGDFELITIRDTAGGIPEDLRDNLFQPFTSRRSGGTGLGLFMAYQTITNTHKGKMWFDTQTGKGTTFFIKLPILHEDSAASIRQHQFI